jgi:TolB-like protein
VKKNAFPNKDNAYLCNGMMEEILNQHQKIGDLKVKSRTSVDKYRNPNKDITEISKELKVSLILEGSVRKVGDDLRIAAQLIDAETGDHLGSEIYDG